MSFAPSSPTAPRRVRDLLVIDDLVVAADSLGGIGPKPGDTVAADAVTVAHFALRVPLLEVLCARARPIAVIDNLCVELEPTGRLMIEEIRRLAAVVGIPGEAVTGSTEDNVEVTATAVGVTVLGRLAPGDSVGGGSRPGHVVVCAGLPISAPRDTVFIGHPGQVTIEAVRAVLDSGLVRDAVPVGSKGLAWEVEQLATSAGLSWEWAEPLSVSRHASGGPASCVLFSCDADDAVRLAGTMPEQTPVSVVARLLG